MEEENWIVAEDLPVKKSRIEAFALLVVALAFAVLVGLIAMGVVDADKLAAAVASVLSVATLVIAWWRDNNVTLKAILRHQIEIETKEEEDGQ